MPFKEGSQFEVLEHKETLGHQIEYKVGEFIGGSFDCIENIESTKNNGVNDKKGVDLILTFEDGNKMAIDVTTDEGIVIKKKIESMARNPMVSIAEEKDSNGELMVEKTKTLIPRGIIHVRQDEWAEYNIEKINDEVIVYMPDKIRIIEEKNIIKQLINQIDFISKGSDDYLKKTESIKDMLSEQLEELEELEKELL